MISTVLVSVLLSVGVPDVIPSGMKGVRVESHVALAGEMRRCCTQYEIVAGDTLSSIAVRWLGSVRRFGEILALNPDIEPNRLRVGERIWIPPREPLFAVEMPIFLYVDLRRPFTSQPTPLPTDGLLARTPRGQLVVFAVPAACHAQFVAAIREGPRAIDAMVAQRAIQRLDVRAAGSLVESTDPTVRRVDRYLIDRDEQGALTLAMVSSIAFDANDEPIRGKGRPEEPIRRGGLALVGALGAAALLWRRRSRRSVLGPQAV